jgi:opacity protein-like surface antigen
MKGLITCFFNILLPSFFITGLAFLPLSLNAQTSCPQNLTLARNLFTQGRYYEIEPVLNECLKDGFTKQEKIEALEMLSLTYVYLDYASKADSTYLMLLKLDPEHIVDPATDLPDLVFLHQSFRTKPIFRWNVNVGLNRNYHRMIYQYSIFPELINSPGSLVFEQKSATGYNFGAGVEFNLYKKLSVALEGQFMNSQVTESYNSALLHSSGTNPEYMRWINVPLYFKYEFDVGRIKPYVTAGGSFNYLAYARYKNINRQNSGIPNTTLNEISVLSISDPINYSVRVGGGVMYKAFETSYIVIDVYYGLGLTNITEEQKRYSLVTDDDPLQGNIITFDLVRDAFRVDQLVFSLKFLSPFYKPKKIIPR